MLWEKLGGRDEFTENIVQWCSMEFFLATSTGSIRVFAFKIRSQEKIPSHPPPWLDGLTLGGNGLYICPWTWLVKDSSIPQNHPYSIIYPTWYPHNIIRTYTYLLQTQTFYNKRMLWANVWVPKPQQIWPWQNMTKQDLSGLDEWEKPQKRNRLQYW